MPIIKLLTETNTRYFFYQELRELWENGIETIERIQPQYRSKSDDIIVKQLKGAVELIDNELLRLSNFDQKKFDLRRTIDAIPANQWRKEADPAVPDNGPQGSNDSKWPDSTTGFRYPDNGLDIF